MIDAPTRHRLSMALGLTVALAGCGGDGGADMEIPDTPLMHPSSLTATAPETFRATFETTAGTFVVEVHRAWAPIGVDRFYNLAANGFYDDTRIFRVVPGFMAQTGLSGHPLIQAQWSAAPIQDDPVVETNTRGRVTFAKTNAPDSRTTQFFINFGDNVNLDEMGFAPFGEVVEGMEAVDAINAEYGETPYQPNIRAAGNEYLDAEFPNLTRILRVTVE